MLHPMRMYESKCGPLKPHSRAALRKGNKRKIGPLSAVDDGSTIHPMWVHESKFASVHPHIPALGCILYVASQLRCMNRKWCTPFGGSLGASQLGCTNRKDEHDGPYEMNRNKLVDSRTKRNTESKRNVGVYCAKYDLHK